LTFHRLYEYLQLRVGGDKYSPGKKVPTMKHFDKLIKNIEKKTGMSIEDIKLKSPEQQRDFFSKKTGKPLEIITEFPFIGRGNVLRGGLVSSSKINKEIDKILGL
jgi:hypothetical protein